MLQVTVKLHCDKILQMLNGNASRLLTQVVRLKSGTVSSSLVNFR